jgi:outer membrane protein OmpA-like peptidoglycan-associated protein
MPPLSATPPAAPARPAASLAAAPAPQPAPPPPQPEPAAGPIAAGKAAARVLFPVGSSDLPESAKAALKALAERMNRDADMRVQLLAYAGPREDTASQARRLSLFRALAVRSYMIEQGIRSTRMDVRALGNKYEEEPADRVDVVIVDR